MVCRWKHNTAQCECLARRARCRGSIFSQLALSQLGICISICSLLMVPRWPVTRRRPGVRKRGCYVQGFWPHRKIMTTWILELGISTILQKAKIDLAKPLPIPIKVSDQISSHEAKTKGIQPWHLDWKHHSFFPATTTQVHASISTYPDPTLKWCGGIGEKSKLTNSPKNKMLSSKSG